MIGPILVVAILILVNAVYVAAEFGSVGVRPTRIDQLAGQGSFLARLLQPVVHDPLRLDSYISAAQIGITASSLIIGAYAERVFGDRLAAYLGASGLMREAPAASVGVLVTLVALSALQVVLGELLPKALAMRYPSKVAMATVIPMRWSLAAFGWLIWLLNGSVALVLRGLGVSVGTRRHVHVAEEIDLLVEESHEGGLLDDAERQRLHNVFRLASRRVREVMIPRTRVFGVDIDTPVEELLDVATGSAYTRLPVFRENLDNVVGLVHVKDLLAAAAADSDEFSLRSLLREVPRVLESVTINRLLSDMRARHVQMSLVVDEYGGTAGIVTLEDLLEEVVGDIPDEYAKDEPGVITQLRDGRFRLPGAISIADINERFALHIDYGEADTLAGLVMGLLGRMPGVGDRVAIDGAEIEVLSVASETVEWAALTPDAAGAGDEADD